VTPPGTAKNCITVGASENRRLEFDRQTYGRWWPQDYPVAPFWTDPMADDPEQVAAFSSRGPTRDHRVKPDLVAPGTFVLSTRSTRRGVRRPSAALLKAALVAGATRLPGYSGPAALFDPHQGFGRANLEAVLAPGAPATARFLDVRPGLRTGESWPVAIEALSDASPLRVVLAYSDFPGPALVNNLNLVLHAPSGAWRAGNQAAGQPQTLDNRNNVEVVHVTAPGRGRWRIEVVGSSVPEGPQPFALVILGHLAQD
jgi:hypothetical protein